MPDLRRQRRVTYHTNIRLRLLGREESVVARVQNLSTSGVFVTAAQVPPAGTDVLCRMLVAGERCTLKGKVAWVRPPALGTRTTGAGAGIGFVDLSARHAELLERLLEPALNGNGVDPADRVAAELWFDGVPTPIQSQALVNDDSLTIATKLPFLKLSSPIRLTFVRRGVEEVRKGTIEAVTLEPSTDDGVPRLHLVVQTPPLASAKGTIEVRDVDIAAVLNAQNLVQKEPRTVIDAAAVSPSVPPANEVTIGVAPGSASTYVDLPTVPEPTPPLEVASEGPAISAPHVPEHDRTQRVQWADQPDQIVPVQNAALVAVAAAQARKREMTWRWAVAACSVVLVAAAGGYAASRAPAPPPASASARAALEIERMPEAAIVPAPVALTTTAEAPAPSGPVIKPLPSPAPERPAATIEPNAPGYDSAGFAVGREVDNPWMTVALVGSAKGMMYYRLNDPPGVVVNLPRAYPRSTAGVHNNLPGAFRRMVIQRKGPGSVLRIYQRDADQVPQVLGERDGLRVTLKGKRPKS
jgi:Tfp pilus assembly protein PilZ